MTAADHIAVQKDGVLDHSSSNNLSPARRLGLEECRGWAMAQLCFDWDPSQNFYSRI